jgi:hypothetical protein
MYTEDAASIEDGEAILTVPNSEPQRLPTLGVWRQRQILFVSSSFPDAPDFTCDSWCYENDLDSIGARALGDDTLELRHRVNDPAHVTLVTTVTAEPGAVEFVIRPELDAGAEIAVLEKLFSPNLCWQLCRARAFASSPDPYPEFVKRCFIFSAAGRTFLHETVRRPIPTRPPDDFTNNPPWVQWYAGAGQEVPQLRPDSPMAYSGDRYVAKVIGAVSRDGRYLAALASSGGSRMAQAWHDCLHNNAGWEPAGVTPDRRRWRLKVYVMENDPDALLEKARRDFPDAVPLPGA